MADAKSEKTKYPVFQKEEDYGFNYPVISTKSIGINYQTSNIDDIKNPWTVCIGGFQRNIIRSNLLVIPQQSQFTHLLHQKDHEILFLNKKIGEMQNKINLLERKIDSFPLKIRFVEIIDKTQNEVDDLVLDYYKSHNKAYPSDIAEELGLSLEAVFNSIDKLVSEGRIKSRTE